MNQTELDLGTVPLIGETIATIGVAGWMRTPMEKFRTMGGLGRPVMKKLPSFRGLEKKFPFSLTTTVVLPLVVLPLFLAGMASAATVITPGVGDPGRSASNPFDYSDIHITSNSATYSSGSNIQDIFGGSFSTLEAPGRTIFADTAMQVTPYQVSFTTNAPVNLSGFSLFLQEDGGGSINRSATNFELIANGAVISNVALAGVGQSYAQKFGSDSIEVSASFSPVIASSFQIIFTSNNGYYNGIRVLQFNGQGSFASSGGSLDPTPEPSSIQLAMLSGLVFAAFCRRRFQH